jgi:hypothetical protein
VKTILTFILSLVLMLGVVTSAGCSSPTKIGDIIANPNTYSGKEISIQGTVGKASWFAVAGKGVYQLGDGTGNIWIVTKQPPPQNGQSVSTKGTVQTLFQLLDQSYGTVIIETSRK